MALYETSDQKHRPAQETGQPDRINAWRARFFVLYADMQVSDADHIIDNFHEFIGQDSYPCVAARAAMMRRQIPCLVVDHMGCPSQDRRILSFLYKFISAFRNAHTSFHSAAVIWRNPRPLSEPQFDELMWRRLQALSELDAARFPYDRRVASDPKDPNFSYSLAEEAFFVIGLHPASSRRSRQFEHPALIFNPHIQFDEMRKRNQYEKLKKIVRSRDILYSGSVNPTLSDFGEAPEVYQYSGRQYDNTWTCPLKVTHEKSENNSAPE